MLIRHYRHLHRPVPPHHRHERSAYGGWTDTVIFLVVVALTTLAIVKGWA